MDSRKAVVCLLLSFPIARALPAVSSVVITTYTLSTGIQTVQSVAVSIHHYSYVTILRT